MKHKKKLKAKQLKAVQLLAMGEPKNVIAAKLEITTMTLYRWQKQPEFNSKLNFIAHSGLEEIAKKMNATTVTAIETLQEAMCDMREPSTVRIKAAIGVLNAMPSVNGALEKGLKHRVADFDLRERWNDIGFSYDINGDPIQKSHPLSSESIIEI